MHSGRWNDIFTSGDDPTPSSIRTINLLPHDLKRQIYSRLVPTQIYPQFDLTSELIDPFGQDLIDLQCKSGSAMAAMSVYHQYNFQDPIIYGQITDTMFGQIHILLYVINDPESQRFDIDRMPDGTETQFGTLERNISEELKAFQAGLAPGQIRRGLRLLGSAIETFEDFSLFLGHDRFFAEPLYYHNAVILERAGFAYLKGRQLMEQIDRGFKPMGSLSTRLDGSTPFRDPQASSSIRLRSWALHDGIMDNPFTNVTMYKIVNKNAGIFTTSVDQW